MRSPPQDGSAFSYNLKKGGLSMKKALWLFVALTAIGAVVWWLWENIVWGKN